MSVLNHLDEDDPRLPPTEVRCRSCPNSMWFSSPTEVKCYCKVMFLVSWSTDQPNEIHLCDGAEPPPTEAAPDLEVPESSAERQTTSPASYLET